MAGLETNPAPLREPAPSLFGFAPGGVYRAASVTGRAVGSYPTLSPLPQARIRIRRRGGRRRFAFCGTFPGVAPAGCYPAPCLLGARTFLSRTLSGLAAAAVRPTDPPPLRTKRSRVKDERCHRLQTAGPAIAGQAADRQRRSPSASGRDRQRTTPASPPQARTCRSGTP